MIWKIIVVYLIGFAVTVLIRVVDAKIEMIKIRGIKEDILIFSLLWLPEWILLFLFLALDKLKVRKVKKALRAED